MSLLSSPRLLRALAEFLPTLPTPTIEYHWTLPISPGSIHFKRSGTFGTDPPELRFQLKDIVALDCIKAGFSTWLVVRQPGRTPACFTVNGGEAGGPANTRAFYERLNPLWNEARPVP